MSNNCLVTKLKGVVDNDRLNKLGELRMMVKLSSFSIPRTNAFFSSDTTPFEVTLLDDGVTFTSATGDAKIIDSKHGIATGRYISTGNSLIVSGAAENSWINISAKSKYEFGALGFDVKDIQLSDVKYCTSVKKFVVNSSCPKYGTLKDLSGMTLLELLTVWTYSSNTFTGNMSDLGVFTNLTTMTVASVTSSSMYITGSWDDFVVAQRSNGRTTCDGIDILNAYYSFIPFGSRSNLRVGGESEKGILKWDASKISIQFDTSHKVLTIGYTAEEAAAAFTDYEVIMCDPS